MVFDAIEQKNKESKERFQAVFSLSLSFSLFTQNILDLTFIVSFLFSLF